MPSKHSGHFFIVYITKTLNSRTGFASFGFIFVTPSHQYPLGETLPIQRRIDMLHYAKSKEAFKRLEKDEIRQGIGILKAFSTTYST